MPGTELRVLSHLIFIVTSSDSITTTLTNVETKVQKDEVLAHCRKTFRRARISECLIPKILLATIYQHGLLTHFGFFKINSTFIC